MSFRKEQTLTQRELVSPWASLFFLKGLRRTQISLCLAGPPRTDMRILFKATLEVLWATRQLSLLGGSRLQTDVSHSISQIRQGCLN